MFDNACRVTDFCFYFLLFLIWHMHLIYLFQSVFMSNAYIIVHETAVNQTRVSLMRTLQKYLRLRDNRDVCFCLF